MCRAGITVASIARADLVRSADVQMIHSLGEEINALFRHGLRQSAMPARGHGDEMFKLRMQAFEQFGESRVHDRNNNPQIPISIEKKQDEFAQRIPWKTRANRKPARAGGLSSPNDEVRKPRLCGLVMRGVDLDVEISAVKVLRSDKR